MDTRTTRQDLTRWERLWTGPLWVKFVVCIAVGLAFGLILGAAITKASGQPTSPVLATAVTMEPTHRCDPTGGPPCPAEARWHARKFRNDKVDGWKNGVPVKKFYIKPAAVRKVWVHKIARLLKQRAQARGTADRTFGYRAQAIEKYDNLVTYGSCATWAHHYAAWNTSRELCTRLPGLGADPDGSRERWMTAEEVKAFGAAALCAGGTVATVVSMPPTAGTSAAVAVGFGGLSCIYGLWASMS